jgi:hypothetical protein
VYFGGDEHASVSLPDGWEEVMPRAIIRDEAEFERWLALDLDGRLSRLAPSGFRCLPGLQRS